MKIKNQEQEQNDNEYMYLDNLSLKSMQYHKGNTRPES